MQKDVHPEPSPPPSGGVVRLQARVTHLTAWLGPTWATLCGIIASGGFRGQGQDWLRLALLILLVEGGWGTLWAALGGSDWATPLHRWRHWDKNAPVAALPYTLPGAPGGQTSDTYGGPAGRPVFELRLTTLPSYAIITPLPQK